MNAVPTKQTAWIVALACATLISACADREAILPGQRENLRDILSDAPQPAPSATENRSLPISLGAQSGNSEWTQSSGSPATRIAHAQLRSTLTPVWSNSIGAGNTRRSRITAAPVVAGGRVFTLDSQAQVVATSTNGATLWARDLVPSTEKSTDASGGGLAYNAGRVFVSSGFGLLTALDATSGTVIWQQKLEATGSGSPTVYGGTVYLVAGDDTAWAVNADTGRVQWQLGATPNLNNLHGAPAPAVTDKYAMFAFGSGEVQTALRQPGQRIWETVIAGQRAGFARSEIRDVTGDPVIVGNTAYVGTFSGRTVAYNLETGEQLWRANEGPQGPVWAAGGSIFLVSDRNELLRLDARDGSRIWGTKLPFFVKDRPKKQKEIYTQHGPIAAGGRIVLAGGDGMIRMYDPASGALVATTAIPGGATASPVVAGGTLYVVSAKGQLHAFR
jgi:outer membrane protein assembly factor BamB